MAPLFGAGDMTSNGEWISIRVLMPGSFVKILCIWSNLHELLLSHFASHSISGSRSRILKPSVLRRSRNTELSNYMLYNFKDNPRDLFERMRLNVDLNEELGVRIFSFPMRYQPVTRPDRGHIGPKWNSYYLRSMQVILQATHGIVSGAPDFFRKAYGDTYEEFESILLRPHHFIFNRYWYEQFDGRAEFDSYLAAMNALNPSEREELIEYLSGRDKNVYETDLHLLPNGSLRGDARYFIPMPKNEEALIWEKQKKRRVEDMAAYLVPEDERVEDAALTDQDVVPLAQKNSTGKTRAYA